MITEVVQQLKCIDSFIFTYHFVIAFNIVRLFPHLFMKLCLHSHSLWKGLTVVLLTSFVFTATSFGWQQAVVGPIPASALTGAEREAAASLKADTIRDVASALASSEMQGRGTAQPGGEKAAQYIAERFAKLGVKPLGDKGTYLQKIKFKATQVLPESSLKAGDEALEMGSDFVVSPPYGGDRNVSGNMVFVAYGLLSSTPKRDDLRGVDVKGKIVVLLDGPPKGISKESWDKADISRAIIQNLINLRAAGLIIANSGSKENPYETFSGYLMRRRVTLADAPEYPAALPPFIYISDKGAEKLFVGSGMTYAEALARAESGEYVSQNLKPAKITVRLQREEGVGSNVIGLIEGSDQTLKEQAVVYTAHYDAFGVDADKRIFHGAADNALGVGEVISIAEVFAHSLPRTRRSIVFLIVTGEEYGLLGSEYWIDHPTWKIKQVAANLNSDGIGTEVYGSVKSIVGFGSDHSDLSAVLKDVAAATGVAIAPDPSPEEKLLYRGDHYAFIKKGVPALKLLGIPEGDITSFVARTKKWRDTDYHQPTDIILPEWNWGGARTLAIVNLIMGFRIANADEMPKWLPSSPYNRTRGTNEPPPPRQ